MYIPLHRQNDRTSNNIKHINKMTATEKVNELRSELKKLGYNNRKVSVKLDRGTFEDAIWVNVKPELSNADFLTIKTTSEKYQSVDYHKGEIVTGGNLYVFVQ